MKKLATLNVWLDSDNTGPEPGSSATKMTGENEWMIILAPNGRLQAEMNHLEEDYPLDAFAHELGHFVSQLFGLPAHTNHEIAQFLGISHPIAPKEAEAWMVAEKINPAIADNPVKAAALGQYQTHDERVFG